MSRFRSLARSGLFGVAAVALLLGTAAAPDASAVTLGQLDGSEDGALQVAIDPARWLGNHLTQNVLGISANANNPANDFSPRRFVADPASGPPTNFTVSTQPIALPRDRGATNVVFATTAGALAASNGSLASALAAFREVRNLQNLTAANLTAAFPGEVIAAPFSICKAAPIPEPGTGLLVGLGLAVLAARRRRA